MQVAHSNLINVIQRIPGAERATKAAIVLFDQATIAATGSAADLLLGDPTRATNRALSNIPVTTPAGTIHLLHGISLVVIGTAADIQVVARGRLELRIGDKVWFQGPVDRILRQPIESSKSADQEIFELLVLPQVLEGSEIRAYLNCGAVVAATDVRLEIDTIRLTA
jgi:hypothetical protein